MLPTLVTQGSGISVFWILRYGRDEKGIPAAPTPSNHQRDGRTVIVLLHLISIMSLLMTSLRPPDTFSHFRVSTLNESNYSLPVTIPTVNTPSKYSDCIFSLYLNQNIIHKTLLIPEENAMTVYSLIEYIDTIFPHWLYGSVFSQWVH